MAKKNPFGNDKEGKQDMKEMAAAKKAVKKMKMDKEDLAEMKKNSKKKGC